MKDILRGVVSAYTALVIFVTVLLMLPSLLYVGIYDRFLSEGPDDQPFMWGGA